ncbi:GNAT family N-acetyltransferase [Granulosicoccaceae sp. 1_MG-2023]|nr:GNAT family N-acetyltransferase [Granulosicoccaceae sp. 1_MG-2023]
MSAITVRDAIAADAPLIARCNVAMAAETEDKPLDATLVEQGVANLIGNPARGFYRLAEYEGEVAGSLMITYEWSDWRNADIWWIQSVYVLPALRRRGVFRALYRDVEQAARKAGACGLRLYAETANHRAHRTYEALGMSSGHYAVFEAMF